MPPPLHHPREAGSNIARDQVAQFEPKSLRTYTPTQAVLERSAGIYHWTPEGRRLYDFSSGVLVANLGHNPWPWMTRFTEYRGLKAAVAGQSPPASDGYFAAQPFTAYNAVTRVETEATRRLIALLQNRPGGKRLEQVMWAASGSEAIQKALWTALARDPARDMILATRHGFHGKKGLSGAGTGSETDRNRDPRVRVI